MPIIPDELKGLEGGLDITGKWILTDKGKVEVNIVNQMEDPTAFLQELVNTGPPPKIVFFYFLMNLENDGMSSSRIVYNLYDLGFSQQHIGEGFLSLYNFGYITKLMEIIV